MRILFSKPDSLGDQLIAAGPVQALRRLRPEIRLVWHVRPGMEAIAPLIGAEVFQPDPGHPPAAEAARLMAHPAPLLLLPYPLSPYEPWTNEIRGRVAWWAEFLRATAWDATVLGLVNRTWVGDLTATLAPAPVRLGFAANVARQPLVNEAAALAQAEGPAFTTTLTPSFTRGEAAQLRDLLATLEPRLDPAPVWQPVQAGFPARTQPKNPRIVIAPGVGGDARRAWGPRNFVALASSLRTRGASIAWLEGPGDAPYLADIPEDPAQPRLRFGPHDLARLADTLRSVDLLVCHDTAYVHLAAGLGVSTVAIYGAGQHTRFHPAGGRVKIVQSQIACAGCQWHCLWDRLICVADIPTATVLTAVEQMLAGNSPLLPISLTTPLSGAPEGELAAVKRRLQEEILMLNADRFARLQIIQSVVAQQAAPRA